MMRRLFTGVASLTLLSLAPVLLVPGGPGLASPSSQDLPWAQVEDGQNGDLTVWYLGHCGFAIRSGDRLLVFDYQGEYGTPAPDEAAGGLEDGFIQAADLEGLKVYVFVTHSHSDHYDPSILEWAREVPDVQYFFGWEAGSNPDHHYLVGPRATTRIDGMEIYTINSHHSGVPEVAYLVRVDDRWIYHNGDYRQDYIRDFEYLANLTDHIDLVFHAGLTEPGAQHTDQARYLMEHFSPDAFFPIHNSDDEAAEGEEFARAVAERGYRGFVPVPRARGDRWEFGADPGGPGPIQ